MDTATAISANSPQYYQCKYGRVELLNDENYPDWSNTLVFFLTADGTWKVVQGIDTAPPALPDNANAARRTAYNAELQDFQVRSAKACSMIISSLSISYKRYVFGKTNPKDMWDTLKEQLDSLTSNSGPFIRRDQFLNEKHTGKGPISAFFAKLQQYQTQLANTKLPITDFELMSHVLKGDTLDSRFKSIVKTLRLQLDTLT
jgi:gag-polypeptide of LTR copia-type